MYPSTSPALQVVLPLIAAPADRARAPRGFAWIATTAVSYACLAIAIALASARRRRGSALLRHRQLAAAVGHRVPRRRAQRLRAGRSSRSSASLVMPYAQRSIAAELPREQEYLFYAMYCLCLAGLLGIAITGDAFNLFVFLEISSLSTYVLIALGPRAQGARRRLPVPGHGHDRRHVLRDRRRAALPDDRHAQPARTWPSACARSRTCGRCSPRSPSSPSASGSSSRFFRCTSGCRTPTRYAPSVVTAFLAATATKVSVYVLIRFYFIVFDPAPRSSSACRSASADRAVDRRRSSRCRWWRCSRTT